MCKFKVSSVNKPIKFTDVNIFSIKVFLDFEDELLTKLILLTLKIPSVEYFLLKRKVYNEIGALMLPEKISTDKKIQIPSSFRSESKILGLYFIQNSVFDKNMFICLDL